MQTHSEYTHQQSIAVAIRTIKQHPQGAREIVSSLFKQDVLDVLTGKWSEIRTLPVFLKGISLFIVHDGEKQVQYFVGDVIEMTDNTENEASCCDKVSGNNLPPVW